MKERFGRPWVGGFGVGGGLVMSRGRRGRACSDISRCGGRGDGSSEDAVRDEVKIFPSPFLCRHGPQRA